MASQPDFVPQSQPYNNRQPSHNRPGPYSPSRNSPRLNQAHLLAHYGQNHSHRIYSQYSRPLTGSLPLDSSNFQEQAWQGDLNTREDNSEDNYEFSLISNPSGPALNPSSSIADSWQDGNISMQSAIASTAGSPAASYMMPHNQQPIDADWTEISEIQYPNLLNVENGVDPSVPNIYIEGHLANFSQDISSDMSIGNAGFSSIDFDTQGGFHGFSSPVLEQNVITNRRNNSNFDYQDNSSTWETQRDVLLTPESIDLDLPPDISSSSLTTGFTNLSLPMEMHCYTVQAAAKEDAVPTAANQNKALEWQKPLVPKPGFDPAKQKKGRTSGGRRHGHLSRNSAKGASIIRGIRACWTCRISKSTCDPGVCNRCIKKYDSIIAHSKCVRGRLDDLTQLFFPVGLSHLHEESALKLSEELVHGFLQNDIAVDITLGRGFSSLRLTVTEFHAKSRHIPPIPVFTSKGGAIPIKFQYRWPPPLALTEETMKTLIKQCHSQVKQIVDLNHDISQIFRPNMSPVSQKVMKAIYRYHKANCHGTEDTILGRTITLVATFLSMDRAFTFTEESSQRILDQIGSTTYPTYNCMSISRLLNRQIKTAIKIYLEQETRAILKELNKRFEKRKREFWSIDFCITACLCIFMEEVENAIDLQYVEKPGESSGHCNSLSTRVGEFKLLDKKLCDGITEIFHMVYKTSKSSKSDKKWPNSIRDESKTDMRSQDLVEDIRKIIETHDIESYARNPSVSVERLTMEDHMKFRETNSGRLLSQFLMPFVK